MNLPVITTPEADAQIRAIGDWWRNNRPAAPDLFSEELAHCFVLLAQAPMIGKPYRRHASVAGLRRALLRATRYHVYYVPGRGPCRVAFSPRAAAQLVLIADPAACSIHDSTRALARISPADREEVRIP